MKCALQVKDLDIYTSKPTETSAQLQWNKNDGMFILTSSMNLNQIALIEKCDSAKDIMSKLEAVYEHKSEFDKMMTMKNSTNIHIVQTTRYGTTCFESRRSGQTTLREWRKIQRY